ncbi:MAG: endonuclease domain-containing protein [Actinomycetota bacterium]
MKRYGLPNPVRQFVIRDGERFIARVDLAYPEQRLIIEADGYEFHSSRSAFERDHERDIERTRLEWRVIRVTSQQLRRDPDAVIDSIRNAL